MPERPSPSRPATHPSALLRLRDRSEFGEKFGALVADLRTAAEAAG